MSEGGEVGTWGGGKARTGGHKGGGARSGGVTTGKDDTNNIVH
jgi:hypothetical protein